MMLLFISEHHIWSETNSVPEEHTISDVFSASAKHVFAEAHGMNSICTAHQI